MITHPSAAELIAAVSAWIDEIRPQLDERNRFLARVAVNALGVIGREQTLAPAAEEASAARLRTLLGEPGDRDSLVASLCTRLRDGRLTVSSNGLLAALRADLVDQLAIDQPGYRHAPPE